MATGRARRTPSPTGIASPSTLPRLEVAELAARIAHDVRSPLGVVAETLALIRSDLDAHLTDQHRQLGQLADRGLRRLAWIASRLTLLSELERSQPELWRRPIDLVALVRRALEAVSSVEARRGTEFRVDLPEGSSRVSADEDKVFAAVCEILSNAVRHATRQVRVGLEERDGSVVLIIEDDGEGILAELRPSALRRFEGRRSRAGLGVGLSLARQIVEGHGGRLEIHDGTLSRAGSSLTGARVELTLPLEQL